MKHLTAVVFKLMTAACLIGTASQAMPAVHEVLVSSNNFSPNALVIEAGDTVRWINTGGSHNVVDRGNTFRCANGCDGHGGNGDASPDLWQVEVTFRTPGTINYFCEPHDVFGMRGSITVVEPEQTAQQIQAFPNNTFVPDVITVVEGEPLRVRNIGGSHNFQTDDGSLVCSESCEGDNRLLDTTPSGFQWDVFVRFETAGMVPYHCAAHQSEGMTGLIQVIPDLIFANGLEP